MVEEMKELLPFLLSPLFAALGWFGKQWMERRMREATALKTEAEAQAKLAEAELKFAEADSAEVRMMAEVIGSYRTLLQTTDERLKALEEERKADRAQLAALQEKVRLLQAQLARYRRYVAALVEQLRAHDLEPVVKLEDEDMNGGG